MTHVALFVLPDPPGEPESAPAAPDGKGLGVPPVIFEPTRVSRACTRVVLGGYALSVKIENVSELLARTLQSRGIM